MVERGRRGWEEREGRLIALARFPYAKQLYGGRHEISGPPPITASRGAPPSRISGINSTLCDIQIGPGGIFRSNELLPPFSLTPFYPRPPAAFCLRRVTAVPLMSMKKQEITLFRAVSQNSFSNSKRCVNFDSRIFVLCSVLHYIYALRVILFFK